MVRFEKSEKSSDILQNYDIYIMLDLKRSILQELHPRFVQESTVRLIVKRDDLIDVEISGNKWRKLTYYLSHLRQKKNEGFITFGGAFSNHLVAAAAAGNREGMKTVGIVRGDELNPDSNDSLRRCAELGMELRFVSRDEYLLKEDRSYREDLLSDFPNFMIIPEGGAGYYGMLGCQEIVSEMRNELNFDRIVVAQGTTTTSCGILLAMLADEKLDVVPVLKGFDSKNTMKNMLNFSGFDTEFVDEILERVAVHSEFHFEGYGKINSELLSFIRDFYAQTGLKLDPVYTGKAMFALAEGIKKGNYDGETIVFIHTGGLQGASFYSEKYGELYPKC